MGIAFTDKEVGQRSLAVLGSAPFITLAARKIGLATEFTENTEIYNYTSCFVVGNREQEQPETNC